jgi:hypothetical protein
LSYTREGTFSLSAQPAEEKRQLLASPSKY